MVIGMEAHVTTELLVGERETVIKIPKEQECLFELLYEAFEDILTPELPQEGEEARFFITAKDDSRGEKRVYVILLEGEI